MTESKPIRPAQMTDAEEIARLAIELGYPVSAAEICSGLALLLASEHHFVAVAPGDDGQLLGWVTVELRVLLESGKRAEISGLVVTASARRAGVGGKLVRVAEQWAARHALSSICVRSNIARVESHPFYQTMKYVRKKTQHIYEKPLSSG